MHKIRLWIVILLIVLPGCIPHPDTHPVVYATVTLPLNPTVTSTPFLPFGYSFSSESTRPFPTLAVLPDSTAIPPPVPILQVPDGEKNIFILGSDQRPGHGDFRTDVMVMVSFHPDGSVSLISFPRDLYVYLPGLSMSRLNAAYEFGGFELLAQTMDYNFGYRPDHFILTNFSGFMSIIDSLGGVDVVVASTLTDTRTGHPDGFTVNAGLVHMDGETALWYVRSRGTSNDFDRLRRAQEVLAAIGEKLLTLDGLAHIPELYQSYQGAVVTDLTIEGLFAMLPLLSAVDRNRIENYAISPPLVIPWIEPYSGSYYLLPDPSALQAMLHQALSSP